MPFRSSRSPLEENRFQVTNVRWRETEKCCWDNEQTPLSSSPRCFRGFQALWHLINVVKIRVDGQIYCVHLGATEKKLQYLFQISRVAGAQNSFKKSRFRYLRVWWSQSSSHNLKRFFCRTYFIRQWETSYHYSEKKVSTHGTLTTNEKKFTFSGRSNRNLLFMFVAAGTAVSSSSTLAGEIKKNV